MKRNLIIVGTLAAVPLSSAYACSSCGCSLSSDWDSQGVSSSKGWKLDLRYDYLNQNEYRSGTSKVSYDPATGQENETYTKNQYFTVGLDYTYNANWGVSVQLPFIDRQHETNGGPDPASPTGLESAGNPGLQDTKKIGDAKLIGRYQGFSDSKNFGLQFGLKFATGSHTETFSSGFNAGQQLDPGLQPGSGSTDILLGAYYFTSINKDWDYFLQAMYQAPLKHDDVFKPGHSLNVNVGVRYMASEGVAPQLQLNARTSSKDTFLDPTGTTGDTPDDNSGGRTLYLSPGITVAVSDKMRVFGFVQVPVYQNLNGYQLAPKFTASLGARYAF